MEIGIQKTKVTQDFLYEYLTQHNVNLSRLNELMGVSNGILMGCFRHNLDRYGKPLRFSAKNIEKLNRALPELSMQMRQSVLTFGSEQTYTNMRGTTYDPGTLPGIKALSRYFKMNSFCERVLGWNLGKKETVLCTPSSKVYGCVSAEDVTLINMEILSVAGALEVFEVQMPWENSSSSSVEATDKTIEPKKNSKAITNKEKVRHNTVGNVHDQTEYAWEDTRLSLPERSRLWRECRPGGILFFRVNGGYTVEGEAANYIHSLFPDITPYTDVATGLTTVHMNEEQTSKVLLRCKEEGHYLMFTDMYE